MPFKIVRNDITKMRCDAIVNTANTKPIIGSGCDYAVYKAAGKRRLSEYREKNIGEVPEGDVFLTPGFIFGSQGERYIRISLCCKNETLEEALRRIVSLKQFDQLTIKN